VNVPPGGQGGYPSGPWRSHPSTTGRRSAAFTKKKTGGGCFVVAIGLFVLACVAVGAVALVFYLKDRRAETSDDAPAKPAPTRSAPAAPRPPVKRN